MGDIEDEIRSAFDGEFEEAPVPAGLRRRVISKAVAIPRKVAWHRLATWMGGQSSGGWPAPARLVTVTAMVAAIALIVGIAGSYVGTRLASPVARATPAPSATGTPLPALAFGLVPAPGLNPPPGGLGAGGGGGQVSVEPYVGPAVLSWAGQLPSLPSLVPVYRYPLPGPADADAFASRLGATPVSAASAPAEKDYSGPDGYQLAIVLADRQPMFFLNRQPGSPGASALTDSAARAAADKLLKQLNLSPGWQASVVVSSSIQVNPSGPPSPPIFAVEYQRVITLGGDSLARMVDGHGDPGGIEVTVDASSQVLRVAGPFPVQEQSAGYPIRNAGSALADALKAPPLTNDSQGSKPIVTLTHAELVYIALRSGGNGYLLPAYLFTGTFSRSGSIFEKRILVPALVTDALAP